MEHDEFLRRSPASRLYVPSGEVLVLSAQVVDATRLMLEMAGRNEACVFWYGERNTESVVRSVRAPRQRSSRTNYHVEPDAMSQMVRDLPEDWRPLAQIHSHPGIDTEHSRYDDRMVSSRKVLSIVLPCYGAPVEPWPRGLGVHEWQIDYWHRLSAVQVGARLALRDTGLLDVRDLR